MSGFVVVSSSRNFLHAIFDEEEGAAVLRWTSRKNALRFADEAQAREYANLYPGAKSTIEPADVYDLLGKEEIEALCVLLAFDGINADDPCNGDATDEQAAIFDSFVRRGYAKDAFDDNGVPIWKISPLGKQLLREAFSA